MKNKKTIAPVKRNSLTEQVTMKLRQAILDGRIKAGERIIEEDVAAMMKTSRGPVRDSLIQLEHEGLVIRERNRGAMVINLSAEDVEEVWALRVALESLALRYVMERASNEDLDALQQVVQELSVGVKENFSLEKAVDLDLKFHEQLVNASGLKRLVAYWQGLKSQIWFLIFSLNVDDIATLPKRTDLSHRQLIEAIRAKDFDKANQCLKRHMESGYVNFVKTYQDRVKKATS